MIDGRLRIVYLVSTLRRTGPTAQLLNIIQNLDRTRLDAAVVTLSPEPKDSMRNEFEAIGVQVKSMSMNRMRAALHRGWRGDIERLLGATLDGGSIVHSQGIRGDVISSKRLGGVPRVATARNYPFDDYVMKFGPVLGRWMAHTHLRAFRALPVVVACSSTLAAMLAQHGIATKVIRNGVDTSRFSPASPAQRARLRMELGIATDARVGVCAGALAPRKDPECVIRAAAAIDDAAHIMVFVGGGSLEASCRRAAGHDERIRFVGQVDDVSRFLRAADYFVSASLSEGLPNAALEALACGLRVVLSDIGPHRELLQLAPAEGELFQLGDASALVQAMGRAATQVRGAGRLPPDSIAELLGSRQMSRRYQELYLSLALEAARQ